MTLLPALWMAPVELLLPSIWAAPKWSGAGWHLQWRGRHGGEPAPAGEEKAWGRACAGKGGGDVGEGQRRHGLGAAWGRAGAGRGGGGVGKASVGAGTGRERRGEGQRWGRRRGSIRFVIRSDESNSSQG